ncbi:MAG: moaA1 1 [Dehalococcoidia bacterium]|nr:moaA1 1 [Dehalococcoidia bacterium]
MGVPASQAWTVATYVLGQKLRRRKRYPLVLMLEPLFRCNLACAGCGKIQYPAPLLRKSMPLAKALQAVDECGAPIVSIAGGEPLLYPRIDQLVSSLVERRKYVYLCTNALLLREQIEAGMFTPSRYLSFSIHMDGVREDHDASVCREGVFDRAVDAIKAARGHGFRVTTNTTLFDNADPFRVRQFFDQMMDLDVEGMMLSPGYSYSKAPDQEHFLRRAHTTRLFESILQDAKSRWQFNHSPLFLQFLMGKRDFDCTPWGNPLYNMFGWQRPCYLLQDGYAETFDQLLDETDWDGYGHKSGNPRCQDCMVHCGFEATAVDQAFSSFGGFKAMAIATISRKL